MLDRSKMKLPAAQLLVRLCLICAWVGLGAVLARFSTLLDAGSHFLAFLPGIILCSRFHDANAGIASAVLSGLALWDWFVPPDGFALPNHRDTLHLLAFVALAIFICWILRRDRRSNDELTRENVELGYKLFLLRTLRNLAAR